MGSCGNVDMQKCEDKQGSKIEKRVCESVSTPTLPLGPYQAETFFSPAHMRSPPPPSFPKSTAKGSNFTTVHGC